MNRTEQLQLTVFEGAQWCGRLSVTIDALSDQEGKY